MFFLVSFFSMKKRNDQVSSSLLFLGGYRQTTAIYFLEILHGLPRYFMSFYKVPQGTLAKIQSMRNDLQIIGHLFITTKTNLTHLILKQCKPVWLAGSLLLLNTRPSCYLLCLLCNNMRSISVTAWLPGCGGCCSGCSG